jgi:cell wall-associated NlpC family hydrolase
MIDIAAERAAVVAEARRWVGTPFHEGACVRGAGADCGQLVLGIYRACGVIPSTPVAPYAPDWFLHQGRDVYAEAIAMLGGVEMPGAPQRIPKPGDTILFQFARAYSHGGIVVEWPNILHCLNLRVATIDNYAQTAFMRMHHEGEAEGRRTPRPMKIIVPGRWAEGG